MTAFARLKSNPENREALASWYRDTYPSLFVAAHRITLGDRPMAEDLCHDVIVAFLTRGGLKKSRDEREALGYLKRSLVHAHIDFVRKRRREVTMENVPEEAHRTDAARSIDALRQWETLLSSLETEERELLGMMVAGYSIAEIGLELGTTYTATGVRIHRIRNKIRELDARDDAVKD